MKNITVTMIALCIALVSGAALAKSSRIDVLHKPGTPAERVITISESALPAHCRHGDEVVDDSFSCDDDDGELNTICHNNLEAMEFTTLVLTDSELVAHELEFSHTNEVYDEPGECP